MYTGYSYWKPRTAVLRHLLFLECFCEHGELHLVERLRLCMTRFDSRLSILLKNVRLRQQPRLRADGGRSVRRRDADWGRGGWRVAYVTSTKWSPPFSLSSLLISFSSSMFHTGDRGRGCRRTAAGRGGEGGRWRAGDGSSEQAPEGGGGEEGQGRE